MPTRRLFLRTLIASILGSVGLSAVIPLLGYGSRKRSPRGAKPLRAKRIELPLPRLRGSVSVEEALANRRSIREYRREPIALDELAQILWAAQGITETTYGFRAAPSAGATYPLEVYVVIAPRGVKASGGFLEPGSYHYLPHSHELELVKKGDLVSELYSAALNQDWVRDAPVNIVITAIYERTTRRYGSRGIRYVHIEVGHVGQNIYLAATALGLATVAIGAFIDEEVREIIGAGTDENPLYIMPLAKPKKPYRLDAGDLKHYIEMHRSRS